MTYFCWLTGGILNGFGVALSPMSINVMFWSKKEESGYNQAIFGGLGNLTVGIFALMMPFAIE